MNFIKKIFEKRVDDSVHGQFVRFGKGEYRGRAILVLWKSKKIKIKGSFEFANDLVDICSDFGNSEVSGIVMSKNDLNLKEKGIQGNSEEKKGGLYYKINILPQTLNPSQIKYLEENSYFLLLDMEGEGFKLKIKKKLPKPGKDEGKIDDKFCQLETDEKFYSKIKEDFFWDVPEAKKSRVFHNFKIENIVTSPELRKTNDFARIREESKRKGTLKRVFVIDEKETERQIDFEV